LTHKANQMTCCYTADERHCSLWIHLKQRSSLQQQYSWRILKKNTQSRQNISSGEN